MNNLLKNTILKRIKTTSIEDISLDKNIDITNYLRYKKYNPIVLDFINIYKENFNNQNILNKLSTLKIKTKNKQTDKEGVFNPKNNTITLYTNKDDSEELVRHKLMHELIHMASRKENYQDGLCYYQEDDKLLLGKGLNEGYTELLNNRYFSNIGRDYYTKEQVVASKIEEIVGQEVMEDIYFNKHLFDLINILSDDRKEVINIIFKIDKINEDDNIYNEVLDGINKLNNTNKGRHR